MTNDTAQAADPNATVDAEAEAKPVAKKEKEPKEAKPPRPTLEQAYGVSRPADPLSKTGQVWAMADKLSRAAGRPIERSAVMDALKDTINVATIATQYGKWRHFNGLKGVKIEKPVDPNAPPKESKKAKKETQTAADASVEQNTANATTAPA